MRRRQYLVIGAGRFGSALAETLTNAGHEVVVVDSDESAIARITDLVDHAAIVDATNDDAMAKLGVDSFDTVVVAIGSDLDASILATVAAKSAGARHLICKAENKSIARALASIGADEVVRPEHEMGRRLGNQLTMPDVFRSFDLGGDHRVAEVETTRLEGTLADLQLPSRHGMQVLAVRRAGKLVVGPPASFRVESGDRLVVLGANADHERFREEANDG